MSCGPCIRNTCCQPPACKGFAQPVGVVASGSHSCRSPHGAVAPCQMQVEARWHATRIFVAGLMSRVAILRAYFSRLKNRSFCFAQVKAPARAADDRGVRLAGDVGGRAGGLHRGDDGLPEVAAKPPLPQPGVERTALTPCAARGQRATPLRHALLAADRAGGGAPCRQDCATGRIHRRAAMAPAVVGRRKGCAARSEIWPFPQAA